MNPCVSPVGVDRRYPPFFAAALLLTTLFQAGCASLIPQSSEFAKQSQAALADASARSQQVDDVMREGMSLGWVQSPVSGGAADYGATPALAALLGTAVASAPFVEFVCARPASLERAAGYLGLLGAASRSVGTVADRDPQTLGATVKAIVGNSQARRRALLAPTRNQEAGSCKEQLVDMAKTAARGGPKSQIDLAAAGGGAIQSVQQVLQKITTVLKVVERYQRSAVLRRLALQTEQNADVRRALDDLPKVLQAQAAQAEPVLLAQAFLAFEAARDMGRTGAVRTQPPKSSVGDAAASAAAALVQLKRFQSLRAADAAAEGDAMRTVFNAYFAHAKAFGNTDAAASLDNLMKALDDLETLRGLKSDD